ncbi:YcgL domain-containing protein [Vibrio anguillarum]|uniref:YcgL domain-containing protein n=1 Tax=Vibrio anguillarum TaxID=55601 RepID=A0A289GBD1_VIBAN|nr:MULTISPECIES: YcgL domain-containing protein [Vibrio]OXX66741.1 YcgL domain-containing protein [Vibrio sp. V03_P4A6T147]ASW80686.1 YcgL domain-containing protein [Vibrio anguillarum]AXN04298.1 YcgL domain-containing protein [Vibrio anguillarum]AZS25891.1 YcgL domain-containing protein [Vibrio anguillarum]MBF4308772.1 YcgL domain-containing protein [Vibrio anguillarum]
MLCSIYKSSKKEGTYLYIPKKDDFSQVPDTLMAMFGKPTLVMVVKLEGRTLAQVNIEKVKDSLENEGFFLQLPPPPQNLLEQYKQQKAQQKDS